MATGKELLAELRESLLRDLSDSVSGESDTLFPDSTLYLYLNEGYNRLCRLSSCIIDASDDEYTAVALESGVDVYQLSKKVVNVLSATCAGREVTPSGRAVLVNAGFFSPSSGSPPASFALDEETGMIRVFPKPGVDQQGLVLRLRVVRLPRKGISKDTASVALEVADDFALGIVEWAAHKALRNHDADVENMAKADRHLASFNDYVAEAKDASKKRRRLQFSFGG